MSHPSGPQLVRFKSAKHQFEVACNPATVLKWRKGETDWKDVLFTDVVFKNFSKGERANADELKSAFDTDDLQKCLKLICEKGTVAETAAERKEKTDKRRSEIISYIHKYYINPQTNLPHPVVRIENALTQLKIRIDPDIPADRQAHDAIKKIVDLIPLKKMEMSGILIIPTKHVGAAQGVIHKWAQKKAESYTSEGCRMEVSIIPGDYDSLMSDLAKATKGEFQFDVFGHSADSGGAEDGAKKGGKPAKKGGKK